MVDCGIQLKEFFSRTIIGNDGFFIRIIIILIIIFNEIDLIVKLA